MLSEETIDRPNGYKLVRPNAFIMGGAKCATTTIAGMLGQHPEILLSVPKECNFFQKDIYQKGMDWLSKNFFRGYNQEKIVLDASPEYMHIKYVLPRIKESCQDPKFIFIIREPMARAYVNWRMFSNWRTGLQRETFKEELELNMRFYSPERFKYEYEYMGAVDYKGGCYLPNFIEGSLFAANINRYIKEFGKENVFIGEMEELIQSPFELYWSILKFLNIEAEFFEPKLEERNKAKTDHPQKPELISICEENSTARFVATEIFKPDVEELSKLLQRDMIREWGYDKL